MSKVLPWALLVIAVAFIVRTYGTDTAEERVLRERIDSLSRQYQRVDTVRKTDSVRVVRTVHALDTLRVTVLDHLTDTLSIIEYVHQTDTLRTACLACVASAARLSRVNDSLQTAYLGLTNVLAAQKPKRWQKVLPYATGIAGFLLGAKLRT